MFVQITRAASAVVSTLTGGEVLACVVAPKDRAGREATYLQDDPVTPAYLNNKRRGLRTWLGDRVNAGLPE